jgi:hypothetical protein
MAPTSCFSGQVHRLPDAPEAYGAMITRPKAAPAQSRSADFRLGLAPRLDLPRAPVAEELGPMPLEIAVRLEDAARFP